LLRDAYLEEHPAEDDETVDEEWLRIIGTPEGLTDCVSYIVDQFAQSGCILTTVRVILLDEDPLLWTVEVTQHESGTEPEWCSGIGIMVSTRRQIRNLLGALRA